MALGDFLGGLATVLGPAAQGYTGGLLKAEQMRMQVEDARTRQKALEEQKRLDRALKMSQIEGQTEQREYQNVIREKGLIRPYLTGLLRMTENADKRAELQRQGRLSEVEAEIERVTAWMLNTQERVPFKARYLTAFGKAMAAQGIYTPDISEGVLQVGEQAPAAPGTETAPPADGPVTSPPLPTGQFGGRPEPGSIDPIMAPEQRARAVPEMKKAGKRQPGGMVVLPDTPVLQRGIERPETPAGPPRLRRKTPVGTQPASRPAPAASPSMTAQSPGVPTLREMLQAPLPGSDRGLAPEGQPLLPFSPDTVSQVEARRAQAARDIVGATATEQRLPGEMALTQEQIADSQHRRRMDVEKFEWTKEKDQKYQQHLNAQLEEVRQHRRDRNQYLSDLLDHQRLGQQIEEDLGWASRALTAQELRMRHEEIQLKVREFARQLPREQEIFLNALAKGVVTQNNISGQPQWDAGSAGKLADGMAAIGQHNQQFVDILRNTPTNVGGGLGILPPLFPTSSTKTTPQTQAPKQPAKINIPENTKAKVFRWMDTGEIKAILGPDNPLKLSPETKRRIQDIVNYRTAGGK